MTDAPSHSVRFDAHLCDGCLACVRACPTGAVRVRAGAARMLADRCIDCGECLRVCDRRAVRSLTGTLSELSRFDHTVAVPSLALFTQVDPAEAPPAVVLEALRRCGFDDAIGLSAACEAASVAIGAYLAAYRGPTPVLSSFCPTVVRLVQVKYPTLVGQLLPVLPPREVAAREARRRAVEATGLRPERIGVIYVSPCPSKLVELNDHPGLDRSNFDGIVSIGDLFQQLTSAIVEVRAASRMPPETETAAGLGWAMATGLAASRPEEDTLAVAGVANVVRTLDDIEKGRLGRCQFVECHACTEGCSSGALTVEEPFVSRARAVRLTHTLPAGGRADPAALGGFDMPGRPAPRPMRPLSDDLAVAIARLEARDRLRASLPGIDCAACGAPSCDAFAEDVVRGEATRDDCPLLRQQEIERLVRRLAALVEQAPRPARPRGPEEAS